MAEYIEREALVHRLKSPYLFNITQRIFDIISEIPAADVAPVVHGRWVTHYRSGTPVAEGYVSTCCDMWNNRKSDYCPNCGAKMDGERKDGGDG